MATRRSITTPKFQEDETKTKSDFFNDFSDNNNADVPETRIPKTAQDEKAAHTKAQRVKTGLTIFGSFVMLLLAGPFYACLLIFIIEIGLFREIINLKRNYMRETLIKSTTYLVWYIYIIGSIFFFFYNFHQMLLRSDSPIMRFIAQYRNSIFFALYLVGFLLFVMSLKFGFIRYQVRLFLETHISLVLVAAVGSIMNVIYEGIIWFFVAAVAVILNDLFAYQVGLMFGKTRLIDLSPKKTVEGFIGGFVGTLIVMRLVA
jgi:phosphatidate cytidylyltransferase